MQTVMKKHLEWLKNRIIVTPQMEKELLEMEKQQIIKAIQDRYVTGNLSAEQYYNNTFRDV